MYERERLSKLRENSKFLKEERNGIIEELFRRKLIEQNR
jgi:hypothetical protein